MESLDIHINPKTKVNELSVAMMQLIELCRSLSYDSKIIIMDEPTSALASSEIELLFKIIRKLKKKGVAVVFISHKLDEILEICDEITVMRDGNLIWKKTGKCISCKGSTYRKNSIGGKRTYQAGCF